MERCRSWGTGKCRLEEKNVLESSKGSGFTCTFELYLELSGASCRGPGVSMVVLDVLGLVASGSWLRSEREENLLSGIWISQGSSFTPSSNRAVTEPIMKNYKNYGYLGQECIILTFWFLFDWLLVISNGVWKVCKSIEKFIRRTIIFSRAWLGYCFWHGRPWCAWSCW